MKYDPKVQFGLLKKDPLPYDRRPPPQFNLTEPASLTVKLQHFYGRQEIANEVQVEVYGQTTFAELREKIADAFALGTIPDGNGRKVNSRTDIQISVHGITFVAASQDNLAQYPLIQSNSILSWRGQIFGWSDFEIFVKTLTGKTITLLVSSEDT